MAYSYSTRTVVISRMLEAVFFLLLAPLRLLRRVAAHPPEGATSLLIAEPFQMGDVVSLSVMFDAIMECGRPFAINLLVKKANAFVYADDPRVAGIYTADFPWSDYGIKRGSLRRWRTLLADLRDLARKNRFEIGIDTRGDVRSQIILLLLCDRVIGYTTYLNSNVTFFGLLLAAKKERSRYRHRYDINAELLELIDIAYTGIRFPTLFRAHESLCEDRPFTLLHIGGGWEYKRWGIEKWSALIRHLSRRDREVRVIAAESDRAALAELERLAGSGESIRYLTTTFREMVNLIAGAELFVCLDSGPMNIAVCLGKEKIVALFGPGDSDAWYPYRGKYIHKKEEYFCNPCKQIRCVHPEKSCMSVIEVVDVMRELQID